MTDNRVKSPSSGVKPLIAAAIASSAAWCASVSAEEIEDLSVTDALRLCAAFEDKGERLACFEALASTVAPPAETAQGESNQSTVEDPIADSPAETAAADANAPDENATRPLAEDESLTFVRTTKRERERKHAEKERKKRKKYTLTVYRAWRNGVGELRIAFTNGEIWRQSGRGTSYDPQPGEEVVMKPGLVGGWTVSMKGGSHGARMRKVN